MDGICTTCQRDLAMCDWDGTSDQCDACRQAETVAQWLDDTEREARDLAERHGWDMEEMSRARESQSRYYELIRDGRDAEGEDATETIKLRISDHGSAYCSEDISLAMQPSGDDHAMDDLAARLSRPFAAD